MKDYQKHLTELVKNKIAETNPVWSRFHSYTVNGAYFPTYNCFIICGGLLECDVLSNSKEETYAKIGSIIGHEISHAFDSTGSLYDKNGRQVEWWSKEDRDVFNTKVTKVINYFNRIEVLNGTYCNGKNLNGEATADMGGMRVTLNLAKKINNFNYKKYFENYADLWLIVYGEQAMKEHVGDGTDKNPGNEHPCGYLRVNVTVSQFDEFYETYEIKKGNGMYLAPKDRIAIW